MMALQPETSSPEAGAAPPQYLTWRCPACGEYLYWDSRLYLNHWGEIVGCDECLKTVLAEEIFSKG